METVDLVGRDVELAELNALVGSGRLVTVTGPGGVGKTTLVTRITADQSAFGRKVMFADLTSVEDPAGVEPAIAAALGQTRFDAISASTTHDEALVIVDNCEHVLDAAATAISELRAVLPGAAVCATSRVPLGLRDETTVVLGPLGVPPERTVDASASSVELFLDVAQRAGATILDEDLPGVCELCRRIDGVPLAIEIVATRTRSMSVGEILSQLGDRLDTVSQGGFRRDERHRSVRETVEWSYQLLDRHERRLFDRLAAHAGRFSATAAHIVAGDNGSIAQTLDRLDRLVAASLLVPTRSVDGSTWFRQLHAVRACALEHLEASGDRTETTERFVDQMVADARSLAAGAEQGGTAREVAMMVMLLDGFLFAVRWATEHDDAPDRALEIMPVLWGHQSRTDDVLAASRAVIERWPDTGHPGWADAAAIAATCLWISNEVGAAEELVDRAYPVAEAAVWAPVLLRRVRGLIQWAQNRRDDALVTFAEAAEHARRLRLAWFVADADLLRASVLAEIGDIEATLEITGRIRRFGPEQVLAAMLAMSIESDALLDRDIGSAIALARQGLELARSTGYSAAAVGFTRTIAVGLATEGDLTGAGSMLREGCETIVQTGVPARSPVLEAAALFAHRAGHPRWVDLAGAAAACPPVPMLRSAARLLPEVPNTSKPVLDLTSALALIDEVLDAVASGEYPADAVAPDGHRPLAGAAADDDNEVGPSIESDRWVRRGDHWEIAFAGRLVSARHSKGMADLAQLMARPGDEVPAADLLGVAVVSSDTGEVLDASARRQYEQRIRELQADLVEAEDNNDIGRAERVTAELDALVEQLSSAVGLGRKGRRTGGSNERARTAVTRRIRTAIAHLDEIHPALGRHLEASVRTGTYCAYRPETELDWQIVP